MASTCPDINACIADASSSKRRILASFGALLVTATSWVLARATPMRKPDRSLDDLMLSSFLAKRTICAAEYGLENCTCVASAGVLERLDTSSPPLRVRSEGLH